jgi:hypothetical protein
MQLAIHVQPGPTQDMRALQAKASSNKGSVRKPGQTKLSNNENNPPNPSHRQTELNSNGCSQYPPIPNQYFNSPGHQ